ncbi:MAG TPA: glycosyltransferase family 4 protein [Tepidisphaeraceae bacterium]|nr:glycosyltransferase family 4 protein [Tepidisphaeraceae bacterium]
MGFRWIVSQLGARQHYGVPRGFYYRDELRLLYTEAWCRWGRGLLRRGPRPVRAFAGRSHPDIPNCLVRSFNFQNIYDQLTHRGDNASLQQQHLAYLRIGHWYASAVAKDLSRQKLDPDQDVFFGFNTGCLETFQMLRERGIISICDQIDPARFEEQLVFDESERWPGWEKQPGRIPEAYWQRMNEEWSAASMILVNSEWSRQALLKQGAAPEKIFIVPPAYEPEKTHLPARRNFDRPLTVLWIGSVILRKGIQYLIEAAKLLQNEPQVQFIIAGPIKISDEALATAPPNMKFLGRLTRDQTVDWYRQADVFILPTLSDGFAVTQVEAMAHALPVIVTPNCGQVVTDGVDGLVIEPYSGQAIADAVTSLNADRQLLREMSYRALDKSAHFYLPRQAQLLEEAVLSYRAGESIETSPDRLFASGARPGIRKPIAPRN